MHKYVEVVQGKIEQMITTQEEKLKIAAQKIADSVIKGGILHVFGSGHSHMIAEEVFYRAGGAIFVNPDRKSTRLNSSHVAISYAVFCLKKKTKEKQHVETDIVTNPRTTTSPEY